MQEYIQGRTLTQLIDAQRPFTEAEAVRIGIELAKILEYLHGFSPPLVHRDIKPSNVLLAETGDVYLIDFGGVAVHALAEHERRSTIVGTFGYMPPEQFAGQPLPASDVYSLGATLFYLLTHRDPGALATPDGTCAPTDSIPSRVEVYGDFTLLPPGLRTGARRIPGTPGSSGKRPSESWGLLGFSPLCLLPGLVSFHRPGYYERGWVMSGHVSELRPALEFEGTWSLHDQSLRALERAGDQVIEYALESVGGLRHEIARHAFLDTAFTSPGDASVYGQTIQFAARGQECGSREYRYLFMAGLNWRSHERLESRTRICQAGGSQTTQWASARRAE